MTFLKGWRTWIFNAFSGALMIMSLPEFAAILPPEWLPFLALGNVLGNMGLRAISNTPLGSRE